MTDKKQSKKSVGQASENSERPFGKDNVVSAVIDAASELFASHGYSGVSIRDIAKKADVNHGLIYRHFGSKENLRRRTLQYMADAMLVDVQDAGTLGEFSLRAFRALEKHERFWRILARTILDGQGTKDIHKRYPMAVHMIERVEQAIKDGTIRRDLDPKMIVASMFSFSCGYILFEPFILSAVGLDGMKPETARASVFASALSLIEDNNK
jgi:AcrR family transcriptional regulator